jgi:hypothetical protein
MGQCFFYLFSDNRCTCSLLPAAGHSDSCLSQTIVGVLAPTRKGVLECCRGRDASRDRVGGHLVGQVQPGTSVCVHEWLCASPAIARLVCMC